MLARAFATEPEVFLLDEPTADLDPAASHAIMRLLRATADAGRTVVVVLHALDLALRYAHRVVVLADGRVAADLPADQALPAAAAAFGLPFGADPDTAAAAAMLMRLLPPSPFPHKREPGAIARADAHGSGLRRNDGRKLRLRIAGFLSLGLHAAVLAGLLLWFRHLPPSDNAPQTPGAVELVMLEQQGSGPTTTPSEPAPPAAVPPQAPPPQPRYQTRRPPRLRRRTRRCRCHRRPCRRTAAAQPSVPQLRAARRCRARRRRQQIDLSRQRQRH